MEEEPRNTPVRRAIDGISKALAVLSALCVLIVMGAMVADVLRRYTTGRSIPGVAEYSEVLMVGMVFLGLGYAQKKGAHIGVDVLISRIPERVARIVKITGLVIVFFVIGWMAWETMLVAQSSVASREYRFGLSRVPIWPARLVIPLGLATLLSQLGLDILDLVTGRKSPVSAGGTTSATAASMPPRAM
jgi:TRAP-type C4-dicarboxylate transport system permease small subunit